MSNSKKSVLVFLAVLLVGFLFILGKIAHINYMRSVELGHTLGVMQGSLNENNQIMLARISFGEERLRKVFFLRDEIYQHWVHVDSTRASEKEAFKMAAIIVEVSEMYPTVDPMLIASVQYVESSWGVNRVGKFGARGINQIMPASGRIFASLLGLSYQDSMLDDDRLSTILACKYLDFMYAAYGSWEISLADYNGGAKQASYFLKGDSLLTEETRGYVPKVLNKKAELQKKFLSYHVKLEKKGE